MKIFGMQLWKSEAQKLEEQEERNAIQTANRIKATAAFKAARGLSKPYEATQPLYRGSRPNQALGRVARNHAAGPNPFIEVGVHLTDNESTRSGRWSSNCSDEGSYSGSSDSSSSGSGSCYGGD